MLLYFITRSFHVLTGNKGGSLGSKLEGVEEGGAVAATGISVRSLVGATCGDMAAKKHKQIHAVVTNL